MRIKLKVGYHTYHFSPEYMVSASTLIEIMGCKLHDDAGHFVGYLRWDDIAPVNQSAIWDATQDHINNERVVYFMQKRRLDGGIERNKKLPK